MEEKIEKKLVELYDVISKLQLAVVEFSEFRLVDSDDSAATAVYFDGVDEKVLKVYVNYEYAVEVCRDLMSLVHQLDDVSACNVFVNQAELLNKLRRYAFSANVPSCYSSRTRSDALHGFTVALAPKIHYILDTIQFMVVV